WSTRCAGVKKANIGLQEYLNLFAVFIFCWHAVPEFYRRYIRLSRALTIVLVDIRTSVRNI
ncbi:TPA: hypothetical protein ACRX9C_001216, partial [Klebsiella michiganensis]